MNGNNDTGLMKQTDSSLSQSLGKSLSTMGQSEASRSAMEVQAKVFAARQFPRDMISAERRIEDACRRHRFAAIAMYSYPRGGSTVSGPSIKLAVEMAKMMGNISYGWQVLDQSGDTSKVKTYCMDYETNTESCRVFDVPHYRDTKNGKVKLNSDRDIYEHIANQSARRVRACILDMIPFDIQEMAVEACGKTLAGASEKPIKDRVRDMLKAFGSFGITQAQIEKRLGHNADATTEVELVQLVKIYNSIKDEASVPEDWFDDIGDKKETKDDKPIPKSGKVAKKATKKEESKPEAEEIEFGDGPDVPLEDKKEQQKKALFESEQE